MPGPERVLTVPNLLSLVRLAALPWVVVDLVAGRLLRALLVLVVVTSTDWLDGWVARRFDQATRLGAVLDPISDRALFLAVGVGLVLGGIVPLGAMLVLLAREAVVVVLGLVLLAMGRDIPPSSRLGKVATFGLMTALCVLLGAAVVGGSPTTPDPVLAGLGWVTYWVNVGLIYAATAGYALAARPRRAGPLADARG